MKALIITALVLNVAATGVPASEIPRQQAHQEQSLESVVERIEEILPDRWHVVETGSGRSPIGWKGEGGGLYVMVEDTRTRFFHPTGFHYYSFYRVWLMPPDWEGEMRKTPYVTDSTPAYLLGANDRWVAFYHTAGGNVWKQGPARLCRALDLDRVCYTNLTRRIVDLGLAEQLRMHLLSSDPSALELNLKRIIGLTGDGPNLYMEYVFESDDGRLPRAYLEDMTDLLAQSVFVSFPGVESLYLRRCGADTFTDTIVARQ